MENNKKILVTIVFMFLTLSIVVWADGVENNPVPISPGRDLGIAVVEHSCPTFSWSGVEGATAYRLAIFEADNENLVSYEDMNATAEPLMSKEIPGRALSWTPSADEGLRTGSLYVWYVQAVGTNGNSFGTWSKGKIFKVELTVRLAGIKEKMRETLKEYGVGEDIINRALEDMESSVREVNLRGEVNSNNSLTVVKPLWHETSTNTWFGLNAAGDDLILPFGTCNSFFGSESGYKTTAGGANTFLGYKAGWDNTTGNNNTFVGYEAGESSTTVNNNTFIGFKAGQNTKPNIGFGEANGNTFVGSEAGKTNYGGEHNTFIGVDAGYSNIDTFRNTYVGAEAGKYIQGIGNTIIGNHYIGTSNGTPFNASFNVFLGQYAGHYETGHNKLYIDNTSTSSPLIYGEFDNDILAVNGKLGIGTKSPSTDLEIEKSGATPIFKITRTDGAIFKLAAGVANVQIGSISNHGIKFTAGGGWKMRLYPDGTLAMADGGSYDGTWNNASSRELKENIEPISSNEAFDTLENLEPVKYNFKKDKDELHAGFIAEDVPNLVATKSKKNISTMDIVAVLTKVVKEQRSKIKELERYQEKQEEVINELIKRIESIENKKKSHF
jgi:hypothetical protein